MLLGVVTVVCVVCCWFMCVCWWLIVLCFVGYLLVGVCLFVVYCSPLPVC